MSRDTQQAIAEWTALLGAEQVLHTDAALAANAMNITEFRRSILAVLIPTHAQQLPDILRIARSAGVPLIPVSQGKNWGQGSALPVKDDTAILRLDHLNGILEVNERQRYAIIEPGVTQGQLASYLEEHHPGFLFNMTGSGLETSVVGNILERGAAIYGQRIRNVRSMEVLLADGTIIRTGLWHFGDQRVHHYVHGLGPDLNGLFAQSNLGIVTKMTVELRPRSYQRLVCLGFEREILPAVTDKLFGLKEDQIVTGGPVLVNRMDHRIRDERSLTHLQAPWLAVTSIGGPALLAEARQQEFEQRLVGLPITLSCYEPEQMHDNDLMPFLRTMLNLLAGKPSNFSLEMFRRFVDTGQSDLPETDRYDLDRQRAAPGMSCVLPAVPFDGTSVNEIVGVIQQFSTACPFQVGFTFVAHDVMTLEGFVRVIFDRSKTEEVKAAQDWSRDLYAVLQARGFLPYRLHIEAMQQFVDDRTDTFWQTVRRIKDALDPGGILAPGRYCPA